MVKGLGVAAALAFAGCSLNSVPTPCDKNGQCLPKSGLFCWVEDGYCHGTADPNALADAGMDAGHDAGHDAGPGLPICPATGQPMPRPRAGHVMLVPDGGSLYVMGGVDSTGQVTDTVDVYDEAGGWRIGESLAVGVVGASGTLDSTNSGIILVGGFPAPAGRFPRPWTDGGAAELYQSAAAPFYQFTSTYMSPMLPTFSAIAFGVVMHGSQNTVLFTGLDATGTLVANGCEAFEPTTVTEKWLSGSFCTAYPATPRWGAVSVQVTSNTFNLIGGFDQNDMPLATFEQRDFSSTSNTANASPFLNLPRGGLAAVIAGPSSTPNIWAIGGTVDGGITNTVEVGPLLQSSPMTLQPQRLNVKRTFLGSAVLGSKIIVLGGVDADGGIIGKVEIFDQSAPDAGWVLQCDGGV